MPGEWTRPLALLAATAVPLAATIYCLTHGITIVFPHLYYLPIVLAAYWYRRLGVVFSAVLGGIYLLFVAALADPAALTAAVIRVIVFVAIAAVVALLAERIVREESGYRTLFEQAEAGVVIFSPDDLRITESNWKFAEILGYLPEEITGVTLETILPDAEKRDEIISLCSGGGHVTGISVSLAAKDGGIRHTLLSASQVYGGMISATVQDVTERTEALKELQALQSQMALIIEFLPEATFVIDAGRRVIIWNRAMEDLTGVRRGEIIGSVDSAVRVSLYGEPGPLLLDFIFEPDEEAESRYTYLTRDGDTLYAEVFAPALYGGSGAHLWVKAAPFFDAEGNPAGAIESIRDITDRKVAEEQLKEALEELKRSNTELEQFAYVASHDLQEPLRMVTSYVQLLSKRYSGRLDDDADEFIGYAVDGAMRMQLLINDLLAYSRVTTRAKPHESVDCEVLLEGVLKDQEVAIRESGAVVTHDPLPTVTAERSQIRMVFENLISNGIKFHGSEPPAVHVSAAGDGDEWLFSVKDNGIGLDPKYADRIFVIFQRLHGRGEYPGTGIGLAICKRIVERHGGRIWVESEPGHGSVFYFTLPVNK